MKNVLIVDDESAIRETLAQILTYEKFAVLQADSGPAALKILQSESVDVMLLDIKMPGMDGFEVLDRVLAGNFNVPVVVVSGHGTIETAVDAVRRGAYDFLEKPLDRNRLLVTLRNCLDHQRLVSTNRRLRGGEFSGASLIIGECQAMRDVRSFIEKASASDATVLITGENGTGKELVVNALHDGSRRRDEPLVEVNCAAIPRELVESELFGHEKGSFTGADQQRIGKFEHADGGTLFLDEIGDMSEEAQAKVLKAVEESKFERVGGTETKHVNVRIVAATNRDLTAPVSGFRQDLFFRLNVLAVHLPPLREREGDVELLLEYFMALLAGKQKVKRLELAPETRALLCEYSWPGNVRELRNLVERLLILTPGDTVRPSDLPVLPGMQSESANEPRFMSCQDFQTFKQISETDFLQAKLRENRYNISRTAENLCMQRSNLYKKISKYDLQTEPNL